MIKNKMIHGFSERDLETAIKVIKLCKAGKRSEAEWLENQIEQFWNFKAVHIWTVAWLMVEEEENENEQF